MQLHVAPLSDIHKLESLGPLHRTPELRRDRTGLSLHRAKFVSVITVQSLGKASQPSERTC